MSLNELLNEAKTSTADHTKAPESFEFELPPAGPTPARFVGYVEVGKRPQEYKGKEKPAAIEALLFFELNGKKHIREIDGKTFTNRLMVRLTVKTGDKAAFGKLFRAMRAGRAEITNMAQMLGEGFLVTVVHNESGEGDNKRTYANLRDSEGSWKIGPPVYQDPLDPDNITQIPVPEATQPYMLLLWDNPSKAQWNSIFIDGTRTVKDEKGQEKEVSKNWIQESILKDAIDLQESALMDVLSDLGDLDLTKDASKADEDATAKAKAQAEAEAARVLAEKEKAAAAAEAAKEAASKTEGTTPAEKSETASGEAAQSAEDVLKNLGF